MRLVFPYADNRRREVERKGLLAQGPKCPRGPVTQCVSSDSGVTLRVSGGRQLVQMPFLIDWARTPHVIGLVTLLPQHYSTNCSKSRTFEVRNERGYEKVFPCRKILATMSKPPLNALIYYDLYTLLLMLVLHTAFPFTKRKHMVPFSPEFKIVCSSSGVLIYMLWKTLTIIFPSIVIV